MTSNFCVHQMHMRDGIHAIDLGIIIALIGAILQAFLDLVESVLDIQGRAAAKLETRFRNVVVRRTDKTDKGHSICKSSRNMHSYELICNYMLYLQFQGNT